jgi:ABC-type multidrug transport system fused ATPase/permease subunit
LFIVSAVLPSLFFIFLNGKNRYFTSKYRKKFALYSSKLSDVIDSVKEIKLFDLYKKETGEIDSKTKDLVLINIKRIFWGFTSGQFGVAL